MAANVVTRESKRIYSWTVSTVLSFSLRCAKSDGTEPKRGLIRTRKENNRFPLNGDERNYKISQRSMTGGLVRHVAAWTLDKWTAAPRRAATASENARF